VAVPQAMGVTGNFSILPRWNTPFRSLGIPAPMRSFAVYRPKSILLAKRLVRR
jgi:hypothetical protein